MKLQTCNGTIYKGVKSYVRQADTKGDIDATDKLLRLRGSHQTETKLHFKQQSNKKAKMNGAFIQRLSSFFSHRCAEKKSIFGPPCGQVRNGLDKKHTRKLEIAKKKEKSEQRGTRTMQDGVAHKPDTS